MAMFRFFGIVVMVVLCLGYGYGQVYGFLDAGTQARSMAMGGSFVAVADDQDAIFLNPSGLDQIEGKVASYTNVSLLLTGVEGDNLGQHILTYVHPVGGNGGTLGFGYQRVGSDSFNENGFTASWGKEFGRGISLGLGLSYLWWSVGDIPPDRVSGRADPLSGESSGNIGVDVGGLWRSPWDFSLGLFLKDINKPDISKDGGNIAGQSDAGKLPFDIHFGGSYRLERGLLSVDYVVMDVGGEGDTDTRLFFGGEAELVEGFSLRAGGNRIFEEGSKGGGNVGIGYEFANGLDFDYSYNIPLDAVETEGSHRFSFGYKF